MNGDDNNETWLTSWEQQYANSINEQQDYEELLIQETDTSHRKLWTAFQDSATSVAQLYRDRFTSEPGALWLPFQAAAGTVTSLYKESGEGIRRLSELAMQCGYQKRNKEILSWAKKKRRHIRREDLLAYLSGKPPPPKTNTHNHHRASPRPRNISPPPGIDPPESLGSDADLHMFTEALARSPPSRRSRSLELRAFITGEIARHRKRPASPCDVTMDSPTHQKRPRYM